MADDLNLTITIQGVQQLMRKLGRATAVQTLRVPMERSLARLQRALATYPSPPPASTYRRTGNLGRSWKTRMATSADSWEGTLSNAVRGPRGQSYGPFVQGARTQAGMHRGRWITDEQALQQERPAIERDFKDAIDDAVR